MNYTNNRSAGSGRISLFSPLLLLLLAATTLRAADPYTKTIDRTFAAVPVVIFAQDNGHLEVRPATDGQIRFVAHISIDASEEADARRFLERMDLRATASSTLLQLRLDLNRVTSWKTTGNRSEVKFADGERIRGVRNFDVRAVLYVPPTRSLELAMRFSDVAIDHQVDLTDLRLELNNTKLYGGAVGGNLHVNALFGSIQLVSAAGSITGEMTNNRLELRRGGGDLRLNTRFSELELGPMRNVDLVSTNDKVAIDTVRGHLQLNERFGRYRLGTTGRADITSTNGDYTVERGGDYTVNGRFTNITFGEATSLVLEGNANCTYRADRLGEVRGQGSFTDVRVDELTGSADLRLTNGELQVDRLAPSFTGIRVEGSFFDVDLRLADAVPFRARAKLTFGKVEVPDGMTVRVDEERNSQIEKYYLTKNATEASPLIEVSGSNASLRIR
ncbi:hypothetical protein [Lewinella sp. IMCC34183]|uniref:hypothetical protein n=1 Tax=Lewinella sp. IMCC34183 TaxID=2248762 RepID=UPI000E255E9B|nr:hypothetical protein [Lewinella sp. IMCC34183]